MSAGGDRAARRDIRRAVGVEGLSALDAATTQVGDLRGELTRTKAELTARVNQVHLILGRSTADDVANPVLARLTGAIEALDLLAQAYECHVARELAISRSLYTRGRWLLLGR